MTNNNRKFEQRWLHRLFHKTGTSKKTVAGKIYYAHCYPQNQPLSEEASFKSLFSQRADTQSLQASESVEFNKTTSLDIENARQPIHCNPSNLALESSFTVLNYYNETPDTKTFRLAHLNGKNIAYLPGQYMTLSIRINGEIYKRSYSLASSPSRPGIYELTVKRAPNGGIVSNWLNDNLRIGDILSLKGPFGQFTCAKETSEKLLFIAAGSGIVPIMSVIRWLVDTEAKADIVLMLSFRSEADIIYRDELTFITARYSNIKLNLTLTQSTATSEQTRRLIGRITQSMLAEQVTDLPERTVYLCGPEQFMTDCLAYLIKLNVPAQNINRESFTVGSLVKTGDSIIDNRNKKPLGDFRIKFNKSGKTVAANGLMTLLELAEQTGVPIGHECRNGHCGECMVKCLSGNVEMSQDAEIDDFNRKKGWVYACCAYPASNAVVEA